MKAPADLTKTEKATWDKLFANLKSSSPMVEDMAKRYLVWLAAFNSQKGCIKDGATSEKGPSPAMQVMLNAEQKMQNLWTKLKPYLAERAEDDDVPPEFKDA